MGLASNVFVQEIELSVPVNWTTPFPAFPETTLPTTESGPPPNSALGPPASKVGVCANVNDAETAGAPRLQMAKTGPAIGESRAIELLTGGPRRDKSLGADKRVNVKRTTAKDGKR